MKFEIIYADPPSDTKQREYSDIFSGNKITSNVDNHCKTMKTEDIMKLDIPHNSKDCLLYMWVTNPFGTGIKLMNAWDSVTTVMEQDKELCRDSIP